MKSKQPNPKGQNPKTTAQYKAIGELSSRLTDIDLKLDHIIERIKDSLHRLKRAEKGKEREFP